MDPFSVSLVQESGVNAYERMRGRPPIPSDHLPAVFRDFFEQIGTAGVVEVSGPPGCGKTLLVLRLAEAAAESGQVIIFNCNGDISSQFLASRLSPEKARNVYLVDVFDWTTMQLELALLPEVLSSHESRGANLVVFDGLSNPFFYHERKRCEDLQISHDRHMSQLLQKVASILEPYKLLCLATTMSTASDMHQTSSCKGNSSRIAMTNSNGLITAVFENSISSLTKNFPMMELLCNANL